MSDIIKIEEKLKTRETGPIGRHNFFSVVIPICVGAGDSQEKACDGDSQEKACGRDSAEGKCPEDNADSSGLSLLFEVRSNRLKNQPGDICFPGGKIEKGETPLAAGLREFEEETGIPASEVNVIARFDTFYGFADYTVHTFVAEIQETSLAKLKINKEEVEEFFTVPLQFFKDNPPKVYEADIISDVADFPYEEAGISSSYNWRKSKNIIPVYRWQNRVIWGMTARIVKWFTEKIL